MVNQAQPKRILVVEDSRTIREMLKVTIAQEGYQVTTCNTAEDAYAHIIDHPVDLLILDVILPGIDGFELCKQIRVTPSVKHVPIIIQTVKNDVADKIAGFEAGADGYLVKPYPREELILRVKNLLERERRDAVTPRTETKHGKVIAVFAAKGGVGKTTISVNLALALQQRMNGSVALMDADFSFGLVGVNLNLSARRNFLDIVENFDTLDMDVLTDVVVTHETGLDVLLAPLHPEDADRISAAHIGKTLEMLPDRYDLIVVDCQAVYDDRILEILDRADKVLMIVTPEIGPLMTTSRFYELTDRLNLSRDKFILILNRADSNVGLDTKGIERALESKIGAKIISGGRDVSLSNNQGMPLVVSNPKHPFSLDIFKLAKGLGQMIHDI